MIGRQRRTAASVSSLFFVTPALSTVEGAVLFGERLGALALLGLVLGISGVALVTLRSRSVERFPAVAANGGTTR